MKLEQLKNIWENLKHMPAIDEGIGQIYISPVVQLMTIEVADVIDHVTFGILKEKGRELGLSHAQISTAHGKAVVILANFEQEAGGMPVYAPLENPMTVAIAETIDPCFDKRDFETVPRFKEQQLDVQQAAQMETLPRKEVKELLYWVYQEKYFLFDENHDDGFFRKEGEGATYGADDIITAYLEHEAKLVTTRENQPPTR